MRKILFPALAWIALLYAFVLILPQSTNFPFSYEDDAITVHPPQQLWHLANFDGAHYQNIADWGYIAKFQTAFFPLYPLLTRWLGLVFNNFLISGLSISAVSALISFILLRRLTGASAVVALLVFPTSFFLIAGYTESLFLALSLASWLLFNRRRYFLAGLLGFLAALTRFYGILLFPVLLLELYLKTKSKAPPARLRAQLAAWPLLLIPLGLLVYMANLHFSFGDPLQFFHALDMWQKSKITLPPQTLFRYLKIFISVSPKLWQYWVALLEFATFFLGLLAAWLLYRQKQFSYSLYLLLGTLIPAFTGTLQSLPRYLLVLFPLYLILAKLPKILFLPALILQLFLFARFLTGFFLA